jgi:hypothetical protein
VDDDRCGGHAVRLRWRLCILRVQPERPEVFQKLCSRLAREHQHCTLPVSLENLRQNVVTQFFFVFQYPFQLQRVRIRSKFAPRLPAGVPHTTLQPPARLFARVLRISEQIHHTDVAPNHRLQVTLATETRKFDIPAAKQVRNVAKQHDHPQRIGSVVIGAAEGSRHCIAGREGAAIFLHG